MSQFRVPNAESQILYGGVKPFARPNDLNHSPAEVWGPVYRPDRRPGPLQKCLRNEKAQAHSAFFAVAIAAIAARPARHVRLAQVLEDIRMETRPVIDDAQAYPLLIVVCIDGNALMREVDSILNQIAKTMDEPWASRHQRLGCRLGWRCPVCKPDNDFNAWDAQRCDDLLDQVAEGYLREVIVLT